MPSINNMFPSKFLRAAYFTEHGPQNLTIKSVTQDVVGEGEDSEVKPIVYFEEIEQGLALNKTNGRMIARLMTDEETNNWIGKQIQLFQDVTAFRGDVVDCIRVRSAKTPIEEVVEAEDSEDSF